MNLALLILQKNSVLILWTHVKINDLTIINIQSLMLPHMK